MLSSILGEVAGFWAASAIVLVVVSVIVSLWFRDDDNDQDC